MLNRIRNSNPVRVVKLFFGLNPKMRILNEYKEPADDNGLDDGTVTALELAIFLQRLILSLQGKFLSEDGKTVDYDALRQSEEFKAFELEIQKLAFVDLDSLEETERKAFFLNIYNVLTIHGLASTCPLPVLVTEVTEFWRSTAYQIGDHIYTLDDIEHGILRANTPHPASLFPTFDSKDPRLKYSMEVLDARIHFALNCGAKSCPAIRVYSAKDLDKALDMAAKSFCSQDIEFEVEKHRIRLSMLFSWYSSDFGRSDQDVLHFIAEYLPPECNHLQQWLLDDKISVSIKYKEYDWSINKK